ncbi:MAG TPA: CAP domain-containing protein [Brumimicrobium sp.]|nr:CAP domain-containing protein [Brumimicrobium sp.]
MKNRLILFLLFLVPFFSFSQLSNKDKKILRQELSGMINELRESKGLKPLLFNDTLRKAAEFHSEYMVKNDILTHNQKLSKYRTPHKRVVAFKGEIFNVIGENVLHTTAQNIPNNKKDLIALAEEMFNSWKNSPGHYANMTEPEFVYGDLGFKRDPKKNIIYATHVFGTKGYVVLNQLSTNSFRLYNHPRDCEEEIKMYSNQILTMGNNIEIEGKNVILYYHNIESFKEVFSDPRDGIAVDLISPTQLACGKPNELDYSPIHDGILLKPFYSKEMIENNRALGDYRLITKIGEIPDHINAIEYSASIVIIKNGRACRSTYPIKISFKNYTLRSIEPIISDEPMVELVKKGVVRSQIVNFNFKTNITNAIAYPTIMNYPDPIHSIHINTYSSVEGDSINNVYLHQSRAKYIKDQLQARLGISSDKFSIDAKENWEKMDFQLNYFGLDSLAKLPRDSLRLFLSQRDTLVAWDSLLLSQRKSIAIINYLNDYNESHGTLGEFNLRTAVATKNIKLANKALYEMYNSSDYNPSILFEHQIIEFIKMHPRLVGNYTALLSFHYYNDPYSVTEFMNAYLYKLDQLDAPAHHNLMHLYTLVGNQLLDSWDVSSERLSNVIHPLKIEKINFANLKTELILNQYLTFIKYYGQINDTKLLSQSFHFISNHFKNSALGKEDDVRLALFFNKWGAFEWTIDYLLAHYRQDNLNEDGLFILTETMHAISIHQLSDAYIEVNEKALKTNQRRWCELIENNFQIKRNYQIKRMYCDTCE